MTADEVKASLAKAARRAWPNVTRASDLPFPEYWKAVTEWLTFHAPHVGDALMWRFTDEFAVAAKEAEERGEAPVPPKVPEAVREIWRKAGARRAETANQDARGEDKAYAWEHAAERAAAARDFFAKRAQMRAQMRA